MVTKKMQYFNVYLWSRSGIRTRDLLITNEQLLYRYSYTTLLYFKK